MSASGKILDGKYLIRRKTDEKFSKLNFPEEYPPNKYFTLWKAEIRQVVPAGGIMDQLGNLTQHGQKIWNWRHDEEKSHLLNYIEGVMDIYKVTQLPRHRNTTNCWTRVSTNYPAEINGKICSVWEVELSVVAINSTATSPWSQEMPTCFLYVLIEWGSTWLLESLRLVGEKNWLEEAIQDGTCLTVTDGLYTKELYPDIWSAGFVLEYSKVQKKFGSFPEQSVAAGDYQGELLGLMAIHLILLEVKKLIPTYKEGRRSTLPVWVH